VKLKEGEIYAVNKKDTGIVRSLFAWD